MVSELKKDGNLILYLENGNVVTSVELQGVSLFLRDGRDDDEPLICTTIADFNHVMLPHRLTLENGGIRSEYGQVVLGEVKLDINPSNCNFEIDSGLVYVNTQGFRGCVDKYSLYRFHDGGCDFHSLSAMTCECVTLNTDGTVNVDSHKIDLLKAKYSILTKKWLERTRGIFSKLGYSFVDRYEGFI